MESSVLGKKTTASGQVDATFEKAIRLLEKFLLEHPRHAEAHSKLGVLLHRKGEKIKALEHYRLAAECGPQEFLYQKSLGDYLYVEAKQPEAALAAYQSALGLRPDDIDTLHLSGNISLAMDKKEDARKYYEAVLPKEPWNAAVRRNLDSLVSTTPAAAGGETVPLTKIFHEAQESAVAGRNDETDALLDRILRHKADQHRHAAPPPIRYQDIQRLLKAGKDDEGFTSLTEYLAADPGNALAHNDFAVLCYRRGDMQAALKHYEEAVHLDASQLLYRKNLADFYHTVLGRTEEALKLYVEMFKKNARDTEILIALVNICLSQDMFDDAKFFCQKLVEAKPWEAAYREMLRTLSLPAPATARADTTSVYRSARAAAEAGRLDEATALFEKILSVSPDHALTHNDLGTLAVMRGDAKKAVTYYERAVQLDPLNASFQKNLAELYHVKLGRTEDALRIYVDLLRKNPSDVEVLMSLGTVCKAQGMNSDAREFFGKVLAIEPWNTVARDAMHSVA